MVSDIITAVNEARYVVDEFQGCKFVSRRRGSLDFSTDYCNSEKSRPAITSNRKSTPKFAIQFHFCQNHSQIFVTCVPRNSFL